MVLIFSVLSGRTLLPYFADTSFLNRTGDFVATIASSREGDHHYLRSDLEYGTIDGSNPKPHPDSKHIDKGPIDISFRYQAFAASSINSYSPTVRIHSSNKTKSSVST